MAKIWAIMDGGDWYDASVDFVILPEGVVWNEDMMKKYRKWVHALAETQSYNEYKNLHDWLLGQGGRTPTKEELEEVWEH